MKKQIIALFILIITATGLAAETGYRGHQWYAPASNFPLYGREEIPEGQKYNGFTYGPIIYKKNILDKTRHLFYGISEYQLIKEFLNAGYFIDDAEHERIRKQFEREKIKMVSLYIVKNEMELEEEIKEWQAEDKKAPSEQIAIDWWFYQQFAWLAESAEKEGYDSVFNFDNSGESIIEIYNYNDDTRCFIFTGFLKDRNCVIFVPHEQNY